MSLQIIPRATSQESSKFSIETTVSIIHDRGGEHQVPRTPACVRGTHACSPRPGQRRRILVTARCLLSSSLLLLLVPTIRPDSRRGTLNATIEQRANPSGAETKSHGPDPGEFTDTNKQQALRPRPRQPETKARSPVTRVSSSWKIDRQFESWRTEIFDEREIPVRKG